MSRAVELTIQGRKLRQIVKSTVRHDLHLMKQISKSGLNGMTKRIDEDAQEFAQRLLDELIRSEAFIPVLASCFIDADKDDLSWTPESSEQLAIFFQNVNDDDDKQVIFKLAVRLIVDFFEQGVVSLRASLNSSKSQEVTSPEQKRSQSVE